MIKNLQFRKNIIRLATIFIALFIIFTIVLRQVILEYAIEQNKKKVDNILTSHLAMHQYIESIQKPVFYELKEKGKLYKEFFDPRVLSFTFIARNYHYKFNDIKKHNDKEQYYYKLASTNPRNELNTADEFETHMLKEFNKNRELKSFEKVIKDSDNKAYLYYMKPISANKKSCMRCHGTPSDAPKELLEQYGDKRGFFEKEGDIRAIISIKLPLASEIKEAEDFFYMVSMIAFVIMLILYIIIVYFYNAIKKRDIQIAQQTKELEEIAKRDPLTKAYNRRHMDNYFENIVSEYKEKSSSMCIMMIDIDHFKSINDTYGHQVGDDVLIKLSDTIREFLGSDDYLFRYGGEEFLVSLDNKNLQDTKELAESLREKIKSLDIDGIHITISIGVSTLEENDDTTTLIKRADSALYRAKNSARDRVEIA